jgi:ketosteroid isomerase-like protein
MKIRLLLAVAGFAISFALATFAQQKDTVDPKIADQIRVLASKYDAAYNRSDSGAVAALYTQDAVYATPEGNYHGRQAIEKRYSQNEFGIWRDSDECTTIDRVIAVGKEVRLIGRWSCFDKHENKNREGPLSWDIVRDGDTWKIRRNSFQINE